MTSDATEAQYPLLDRSLRHPGFITCTRAPDRGAEPSGNATHAYPATYMPANTAWGCSLSEARSNHPGTLTHDSAFRNLTCGTPGLDTLGLEYKKDPIHIGPARVPPHLADVPVNESSRYLVDG